MADGEEKAGIEFLFEFRLLATISRSMREASAVQSRSMPPGAATISLTRVCSSGWRAGRWRTRQACRGNRLVFAEEGPAPSFREGNYGRRFHAWQRSSTHAIWLR